MTQPLDLFESSASAEPSPSGVQLRSSVPCVYCRGPIPASTFAFWSNARRLLSANCPGCDRRVTLAARTWRRWLKQSLA
jgi:hypothetical protein